MTAGKPNTTAFKYLMTGGAGFIGSHLVDSLLSDQSTGEIRILDNFISGRPEHLAHHQTDSRLQVHRIDLLEGSSIVPFFAEVDAVVHLAANPDVRWGIENTRLDLEQETIATYNVLEAMRLNKTKRILFASSCSVYGDIGIEQASEARGPNLPTSLYGAGKLGSEALISAFCGTFGLSAVMLRFGNIVGERTTHGVIFDFIRHLARDSSVLPVLGDGNQAKPYVYVRDLVKALRFAEGLLRELRPGACELFNVAPNDAVSVRRIAETLLSALELTNKTRISYGSTPYGWPGDIPQCRVDSTRLKSAGFELPRNSAEAISEAIRASIAWLRQRDAPGDGRR